MAYFENIEVKAIGSIDEVQSPQCYGDGELVIKDFTVQYSFEKLWFPDFLQTVGHLQKKFQ